MDTGGNIYANTVGSSGVVSKGRNCDRLESAPIGGVGKTSRKGEILLDTLLGRRNIPYGEKKSAMGPS